MDKPVTFSNTQLLGGAQERARPPWPRGESRGHDAEWGPVPPVRDAVNRSGSQGKLGQKNTLRGMKVEEEKAEKPAVDDAAPAGKN